jgi:hypothetical protein
MSVLTLGIYSGVLGCAPAQSEESTPEFDEITEELRTGPVLNAGTFRSETLYSRDPVDGEIRYSPPMRLPYYNAAVSNVVGNRFHIEIVEEHGWSLGYVPIDCTLTSGNFFVCDDIRLEGPPEGLFFDGGDFVPEDFDGWIDARLFQRVAFTGVVVGRDRIISNELITFTCEGTPANCEALGNALLEIQGWNPLLSSPTLVTRRFVRTGE